MTRFADLQVLRCDLDGSITRHMVEGFAQAPITVTSVASIPSAALARVLRELADQLEEQKS